MASFRDYVGNTALLNLPKTAFLCSRKVPAGVILKCYDWAIEQREKGRCVIGGFHSTIEKDVFHYLLKGTQPIIIALHRGIGPEIRKRFASEIESGRLLIISPFSQEKLRGGRREAEIRNGLMIQHATDVVIGHAGTGGSIQRIVSSLSTPVRFLNSG